MNLKGSHNAPPASDPRQLGLPLPGLIHLPPDGVAIPRRDRVFVNRTLHMSSIEWIGFDMDYTLAIYRQDAMDTLSVQETVKRLIKRGYPAYLSQLEYDTRFPIRGLLIDKRYGHVLKMDRHKVVHKGYHGMRRLSRADLEELYHHKKLRPHTPRFHWIDTLFALSEVTSFVAIVEALERRGERIHYGRLFRDVRLAIDEAHADGAVHRTILNDLDRYIERDAHLARTLHKLRSSGKKTFLLTNSPWPYTDAMMTHLLGDSMSEYRSWQQYFDVVVCSAKKPAWFKEGTAFLRRGSSGLHEVTGPLEKGKIYEGGNLRSFEQRMGVLGSAILYVGDHIYGDILRSKKESAWRTAMIIQELDAEIVAHEALTTELDRLRHLETTRQKLEDELRFYQARFKQLARKKESPTSSSDAELAKRRVKRQLERVRGELREIAQEHLRLEQSIDQWFHPYWGSLLKEHHEMSSFGLQVDLYADVYMRSVSCLMEYSPEQTFHSPRELMPHEL